MFHGGPRELNREEVERRVEVRMTRQKILAQPERPRLWAVIDEAAIRRVVGSPKAMRAQLYRLIEAADEGKTTIQKESLLSGRRVCSSVSQSPHSSAELPSPR